MTEKMKPSGIAWIGDIPRSWKCKKLKYLISEPLQYGANEEGCDFDKTYPRYIRITDIEDNNQLKSDGKQSLLPSVAAPYILNDGDVLFARSGATVGKTFIYSSEVGCAAFAGYLIRASVDKKQILPKYLYYCTINGGYDNWKNSVFTQATIQNIGADKYAQFSIAFPSITEQQCIADFLDIQCAKIDSVIADIEKQIETLQKYKKSIISEILRKGIEGNCKIKDSGIDIVGSIGESWTIKRLKYLCKIQTGSQDTQDAIDEGRYPFYVRSPIVERIDKYVFDGEAVLMAGDGVGAGRIFHYVNGKFGCHQRVYIINSLQHITGKFLYYYMQAFFSLEVEKGSAKSTVDSIRLPMLQNFLICYPTAEEQNRIIEYLDKKCKDIDDIILQKKTNLGIMQQHKKSLIYEYVTGKKRVTEAN